MDIVTFNIDLDEKCKQCGKGGAVNGGICLKCLNKRILKVVNAPRSKLRGLHHGMSHKRLAIYQKAINRIDDYFEYRYAQFDREEIKKHVYDVLDNLAKKLEATKSKEIGKRNTR